MSSDTRPQPTLDGLVERAPSTAAGSADRRQHLIELAVVVLLLAPSALSFVPSAVGGDAGFEVTAIATMLHDAGLVALVALLVWRGAEPLRDLGWRLRRPLREVGIGSTSSRTSW